MITRHDRDATQIMSPQKDYAKPGKSLAPCKCIAHWHDQYDLHILNPKLTDHSEDKKILMRPANQCSEFYLKFCRTRTLMG